MKTNSQKLKLTLLLGVVLLLTACGASKSVTDDYANSSRLDTSTITANQNNTSRPLAKCNQGSNSQIGVATSIYTSGEVIANNKINLKITKIPTYFSQNQNYIEFHKWMMNSSGSKIWGSTRMYFHIYSIATSELLSDNNQYLYWADLQSAAQKVGASTPEQFFKRVRFVIELEDYDAEYDVISTQYFNQSDNSKLSELNTLIPVFDANPALYTNEKDGSVRHTKLQELHPFASYLNQGWTNQTFQTKANEFCNIIYKAE